jgi:hypothetical protein
VGIRALYGVRVAHLGYTVPTALPLRAVLQGPLVHVHPLPLPPCYVPTGMGGGILGLQPTACLADKRQNRG